MIGIYSITNTLNGKKYVGSSSDTDARWKQHQSKLRNGKHHNIILQNSWNRNKEEDFKFEIIEVCDKNSDLLSREEYWISKLNSVDDGFNICRIPRASRFGCKSRPETILKIKMANSGKSHPNWGRKLSKKHCENMSKGMKGIKKPNSGPKKHFKIIAPNGKIVKFFGLRKFCRENNLGINGVFRIVHGINQEYRGWKHFEAKQQFMPM